MNSNSAPPTPPVTRESVWDYPRPPAVSPSTRHVRVVHAGQVVAESRRAIRILETAGAPVWYLPPEDTRLDLFRPSSGPHTICEWKGTAVYLDLAVGGRVVPRAAWSYPSPQSGYEAIAGYLAFYAAAVDEATIDEERVRPQPGGFYGGWITHDVQGPFKGEPGTEGW